MKTSTSLASQIFSPMVESNPLSLYIHIPFCKSKCDYCDFTSFPISSDKEWDFADYFEALRRELLFWEKHYLSHGQVLTSLYIGGGTPSVVPFKHYRTFFNELFRIFRQPFEFTCEVNPSSVSSDFLLGLRDYGCNRISMGMQSPVDETLKRVGRHQKISTFIKRYTLIRSLFSNVNIDLICGLPEDLQKWTLFSGNLLKKLAPEHCSIYILEVEKDTPLGKKYRQGAVELPSFAYTTEVFEQFIWFLIQSGYHQYEISNFSLPGYESVHNHVYWQNKNYLGLGVSAGGFFNSLRYVNTHSVKDYVSTQFERENHFDHRANNSPGENLREFLFMGLRLKKGIAQRDITSNFQDLNVDKKLRILSSSKYMSLSNGYLRLNDYYFIHNREAFEFLLEVI